MQVIIPIVVACISALSAVTIAVFQVHAAKRQKLDDADRDRRQKDYQARDQRREELLLQLLKNTRINGDLAHATALAVKRGQTNGEMEQALKNYDEFEEELEQYTLEKRAASFNQIQNVKIEKEKSSWVRSVMLGICFVIGAIVINQLLDYVFNVYLK